MGLLTCCVQKKAGHRLPARHLLSALFASALIPAAGHAGSKTLVPSDDIGATKEAQAPILRISQWDHGYFRFPLDAVTSPITQAQLRLYVDFDSQTTTSVREAISDIWTETGGSASLKNFSWYGATPIDSVTHEKTGYIQFDVTSAVQQQQDGVISFEVYSNSGTWKGYGSKDGSFKPELIVSSDAETPVANQPPQASITLSPGTSGQAPFSITADGSNSSDPDNLNSELQHTWNLSGDSQNYSGETLNYQFTQAGNYTLTLTVKDPSGNTDSARETITVTQQSADTPPQASFTVSDDTPMPGEQIQFNASASSNGGSNLQYLWNFGDGQTANTVSTSHTYSTAGSYNVQLTITNESGLSDSVSQTVTVADPSSQTETPTTNTLFPTDDIGASKNGTAPQLYLSQWDHAYARFALSNLSDNITNATFRLHTHSTTALNTYVRVAASDDWNEQSGAAHLKNYNASPDTAIDFVSHSSKGWLEFDVTNAVQEQINGDQVITLEVWNDVGGWQAYSAKDGSLKPELVITGQGSSSPVTPEPNNAPVADFTISPANSGNAPFSITANASSSSDADHDFGQLTFEWTISGNSNTLTGSTLNHVFTAPGNYSIHLTVTDPAGDSSSAQKTITVTEEQPVDTPPVAAFTVSESAPQAEQALVFNAATSTTGGSPLSYQWNFGDGQTGTGVTATHRYTGAGTYNATLTVTNQSGLTDSISQTITVTETSGNDAPASSLSLSPADDIGASKNGSASSIYLSQWDHGYFRFPLNGVSGNIRSATFRLYANTTSSLTTYLRLADTDDWSEAAGTAPPKNAAWTMETPIATVSHNDKGWLEFDVTEAVNNQRTIDGVITLEVWNDNGGWNAYGSKESSFKPELIIETGNTASNSSPTAHIAASPQSGTAPLTVHFDASGASDEDGFVYGYEWDFGDNNHANSVSPIHTFEEPGVYTVTLMVQDNLWATDETELVITVTESDGTVKPTASFSADHNVGNPPLEVNFDSSASHSPNGAIEQWLWDFGDGESSSEASPTHTFTDSGNYTVSLTVTDDQGISSTPYTDSIDVFSLQSSEPVGSAGVYFIGNSVTDGVKYERLANFATTNGKTHTWGRHMIPGAPLSWIWNHANSGFQQAPYGHYPTALDQYSWDALSLQPFDRDLDSDTDYGSRYMAKALAVNPDVQTYVFAYYPRRNQGGWEEQWLGDSTVRTSQVYFETLAAQLTEAHPEGKPVKLFPVGHVMYELKKKIDAGQVSGMSNVWDLYADNVHLNGAGSFTVTMTVYAMLYRENPTGLDHSEYGISESLAQLIQSTVWSTIQPYL